MNRSLVRYSEKLEPDELAFLRKKEAKERHQFFRVIRVLIILCFVIPFIMAWLRALSGIPNPFSFVVYFTGVGVLMSLTVLGGYVSYQSSLGKVQTDIRQQLKTVERTHITRKQYMPQNHTYYFYIDSTTRLRIEVSEKDFHRLELGDELNIEYTSRAKLYLGYF